MKALFLSVMAVLIGAASTAQPRRSYVRSKVEQRMDSTYRQQGRKAVGDITYENDRRYKDPANKTTATLAFVDSAFRKGRLKSVTGTAMIFGKHGEAYVTRDEMKPGEPDQKWFVYNYAEKANYIVTPGTKEAIRMPLINMQKMAERAARKAADDADGGDGSSIEATDEYATILGYKARKFILHGKDGTITEQWVSTALKLNLSGNYVLGARLNTYKFPENPKYREMANGFVIRMVQYDKKGAVRYTRSLSRYDKAADEKYFDMSGFRVSDVLGQL